ncbi:MULTISPECIES: xylulokinase [unclassified Corynebacterium]|uniref:xylulokinase n=2 Tax=Corynebacterium TaxID=1716 RepID=UPI0003B8B7A2|nr:MULTISPECIES: FGGY-family carbohydrate kinase [unclassified Corynebacterium]ERS56575.1 hypothetical protein HMPREF1281_00357 [Corynebacterium sp. KPL1855]ERS64408.1 hypothetical protein HMPREF1257_00355 [Corynebacterium sp. KPL1814]ERS80552.1 hypothetical protein HMPREF1285_00444 [Corynebacterium sp. KPL1859]
MTESDSLTPAEIVRSGRGVLGIEVGSTRIKACLIDSSGRVIATGSHRWESDYVDGHWSYALDDVWDGLRAAYADLNAEIRELTGERLTRLAAIGISGMMHGYLAFNKSAEQLVPFRTWRDTYTGEAAKKLSELFDVNIPMRWSVAHFYQALLDGEPHVGDVDFLTTLSGYIHWQLTGKKVLGVGDASGMFPIDPQTASYDEAALAKIRGEIGRDFAELLPESLSAGADAGALEHPELLDPSGALQAGAVACPPEGDAGTGMVATNTVSINTGNVSVGTSIFAMLVHQKPLSKSYPEIDPVTTPTGLPVSMVHCNNGAQEISDWISLFSDVAVAFGTKNIDHIDDVYTAILTEALRGEPDAGGVVVYPYRAGEPIAGLIEGRPMVARTPDANFSLANLMRANLYSVFASLALGMRLLEQEGISVDVVQAHGGIFRTVGVAQRFLAAALKTPVAVAQSASEGGAWGIALLANYMGSDKDFADYLNDEIASSNNTGRVRQPDPRDVAGFATYLERFIEGLSMQEGAVSALPTSVSQEED